MANWGLVIGINQYQEPKYRLRGAVNDALAFAGWCLTPDPIGGGVPAENLTVLLDPIPELPEEVIAKGPATRDDVSLAIGSILKRSNSTGDRFFLYFAGHGVTVRTGGFECPCICLSNFTPELTNNAMNLFSIFERLRSTQFQKQFFFIDACRNIPFNTEFQVSDFDRPAPPTGRVWPQFIAYATQPRNTAAELLEPGFEGGAFTKALIRGLKGEGAAKQWDCVQGQYVVRWDSLFKYAEKSVLDLTLRNEAVRGLIQAPRQHGEKGSDNPLMGVFPETGFGKVSMQLDFNPVEAATEVSLSLGETGFPPLDYAAPIGTMPWKIDLPPRIYTVVTRANQFQTRNRMELVELYESLETPITIEMVPIAGVSEPTVRYRGLPQDAKESAAAIPLPASITSPDLLTQLEIATTSGQILVSGRGRLYLPWEERPGIFRARVIAPNGTYEETLLEMDPKNISHSSEVIPDAQTSPALQWVITNSDIRQREDGLIEPSEAVGPAAFVKLSTLLALTAGAQAEGVEGVPGHKLRSLPLPNGNLAERIAVGIERVSPEIGGLRIVLGDEWLSFDMRTVSVWIVGRHEALTIETSPTSTSIASAETPLPVGSYWVEISAPGLGTLSTVVTILAARISLVVLTQETDYSIEIHQYSLPVVSSGEPIRPELLDPGMYRGARFAALRRIELMQRTYARGRTEYSLPDIDSLLWSKWLDPVAGCLGGYMLLSRNCAANLRVPADNLCKYFGGLSDSHVLLAAYLQETGDVVGARNAAATAVENGIPVFADGVRALSKSLKALTTRPDLSREEQQIVELAEQLPAGSVFTAITRSARN